MELRHISKMVGERRILDDINLSFPNNGLVFIVGASGSGKSTLLNVIGQLDQEYTGKLILDSEEINCKSDTAVLRRNYFSFIFQEFNLINTLNVKENIAIALDICGKSENIAQYLDATKMLGLEGYEKREIGTLSGGEKQRVAIMRAMLCENPVILADEPTGNLDEKNADIIFQYLKEVSKNKLVLIVSHNMEAARQYADQIVCIKDGRVTGVEECGYANNDKLRITTKVTSSISCHFRSFIHLSICSMKRKRNKTVSILTVMTLLLLCIAGIFGAVDAMRAMETETNHNILENDRYMVMSPLNYYGGARLSSDYINELRTLEDLHIVSYCNSKVLAQVQNKETELNYTVVDHSGFFDERYAIEGTLCKKANEIMINRALALNWFSDENCIGKTVTLEFDTGLQTNCVISGVKTLSMDDTVFELYITQELSEEYYDSIKDSDLLCIVDEQEQYTPITFTETQPKDVLYGRMANSAGEVILNINGLTSFCSVIAPDFAVPSTTDLLVHAIDESRLKQILGQKCFISTLGLLSDYLHVEIVGLYVDDSQQIMLYTPSSTFQSINNMEKSYADVYCSNSDTVEEFKEITQRYGYYYEKKQSGFVDKLENRMNTLVFILASFAMIMLLISCITVHFFTKLNIIDRTYEIGILKAMGTENHTLLHMFLFENFLLGILACLPTFLLIMIVKIFSLQQYFSINSIEIYRFHPIHLLYLVLISLVITILSGVIEARKIAKRNVVDSIRAKNT